MCEARRVFCIKKIIIIEIAIILNIGLFVYGEMAGRSISDTTYANREYSNLVDRYSQMELSEAAVQAQDELVAIGRYIKSQDDSYTDTNTYEMNDGCVQMVSYYQTLNSTEQNQLKVMLKAIISKLSYLSGYSEAMTQIMVNADKLKQHSIFTRKDSFSYSNILRTASDFKRVQDVEVKLDNDRGVDAFVHYYYLYYIAAALLVIIIYDMFKERENGVWQIVHNTPYGRTKLASKRLALIWGSSFIILLGLYAITFVTSMLMYGGWNDLANPIQTLSDFLKFTYTFSKSYYVIILFFLAWAVLGALGTILWMLLIIFRNRNHTLICTAAFVGVEVLIYQKIEVQSVYNTFRYINVVSLLKINEIFSSYLNWGYGSYVFSVMSILFFVLALLTVVSAMVAVVRYSAMRPETRISKLGKLSAVINRKYQKVFTYYPVVIKELHKLVLTSRGLGVVFALILVSIFFSTTGKMTFTDEMKDRDQMYLEHGGKDYSYIDDYVAQRVAEYNEALNILKDITAKYNAKEANMSQYINAIDAVQYQKSIVSKLSEYQKKSQYLSNLNETYGVKGWMISDRGYDEILGQYSKQRELIIMLALVTAITFIISGSIVLEHRTGMNYIIRSGVNGRKWISSRKLAACVVFTVIMTAVVYGIDMWSMYRLYGVSYMNAPVMSLSVMADNIGQGAMAIGFIKNMVLHMSIASFIVLRLVIRLMVALITMGVAILVSKAIGKKGSAALMPIVLVIELAVVILLAGWLKVM